MPAYPKRVSDEEPIFDDEEEDEDEGEFKEGPRKLPKKFSRKKQGNPDSDLLEDDEYEEPKGRRPKKAGDNFAAYKAPAIEGIVDKESGHMVVNDELTFRAWVMNKLEQIHETLGKI